MTTKTYRLSYAGVTVTARLDESVYLGCVRELTKPQRKIYDTFRDSTDEVALPEFDKMMSMMGGVFPIKVTESGSNSG